MKNLTQAEAIELLKNGSIIKNYVGNRLNGHKCTYFIDNKQLHYQTFNKMKRDDLVVFSEYGERTLGGMVKIYKLK